MYTPLAPSSVAVLQHTAASVRLHRLHSPHSRVSLQARRVSGLCAAMRISEGVLNPRAEWLRVNVGTGGNEEGVHGCLKKSGDPW